MKRLILIESSPREGLSSRHARRFGELLERRGGYETIPLALRDETVAECRGCCLCFVAGEDRCPVGGDGADRILAAMLEADGVVLFVPDYAPMCPLSSRCSSTGSTGPSHSRNSRNLRFSGSRSSA